jgi:hypothetical protein
MAFPTDYIYSSAVFRLKLDQVAGAGDTGFSAEMGDGDGFWNHGIAAGGNITTINAFAAFSFPNL